MNKDITQTSIEIDNEEFYITKKIKGSKKTSQAFRFIHFIDINEGIHSSQL